MAVQQNFPIAKARFRGRILETKCLIRHHLKNNNIHRVFKNRDRSIRGQGASRCRVSTEIVHDDRERCVRRDFGRWDPGRIPNQDGDRRGHRDEALNEGWGGG